MPWKNPDTLTILLSSLLASGTALVRILYDQKEDKWSRILLEATFCGLLTTAVGHGIISLEIPVTWAMFAGGMIGALGSNFIRRIAQRFISSNSNRKL